MTCCAASSPSRSNTLAGELGRSLANAKAARPPVPHLLDSRVHGQLDAVIDDGLLLIPDDLQLPAHRNGSPDSLGIVCLQA